MRMIDTYPRALMFATSFSHPYFFLSFRRFNRLELIDSVADALVVGLGLSIQEFMARVFVHTLCAHPALERCE
jgi:hypothetical protein